MRHLMSPLDFSVEELDQLLDLAVDSDDIYVSGMYLYDDEKNDAQAGEWLKSYYSDLQVVSENFSDETYQDTTTEK